MSDLSPEDYGTLLERQPRIPRDFYELLGVNRFSSDLNEIRQNYQALNGAVRNKCTGEQLINGQVLLNELAKAMLTLTDLDTKSSYDHKLKKQYDSN